MALIGSTQGLIHTNVELAAVDAFESSICVNPSDVRTEPELVFCVQFFKHAYF